MALRDTIPSWGWDFCAVFGWFVGRVVNGVGGCRGLTALAGQRPEFGPFHTAPVMFDEMDHLAILDAVWWAQTQQCGQEPVTR